MYAEILTPLNNTSNVCERNCILYNIHTHYTLYFINTYLINIILQCIPLANLSNNTFHHKLYSILAATRYTCSAPGRTKPENPFLTTNASIRSNTLIAFSGVSA